MSSIQVVLGLTASLDLEVQQLDVKTTFLHRDLDEEIYFTEGFEEERKEHMVMRNANTHNYLLLYFIIFIIIFFFI